MLLHLHEDRQDEEYIVERDVSWRIVCWNLFFGAGTLWKVGREGRGLFFRSTINRPQDETGGPSKAKFNAYWRNKLPFNCKIVTARSF